MRPCCARRSVLSSSLMVLFEIFDPYGEQFLETSTEKTALQLPKKQPWTRLMHKQIYLSLWQYFSQNVQSVQYISVHAEEKDSGYDHGGCIELLYNRISFSKTQKVIWLKMKSTNQNTSASEYRLCWWTRVQMKRRPTIITVHLPAASLSAGGPRSRWKTILTCIHTNNNYKYNNSKLKRKWEWTIFQFKS